MTLKNEKKLCSYEDYDLEFIIKKWESGWRNFASFVIKNRQNPYCGILNKDNSLSHRMEHGFREIYSDIAFKNGVNQPMPSDMDVFTMANVSPNTKIKSWDKISCIKYPRGKDDGDTDANEKKFISIMCQVSQAFIDSKTVGDAIEHLIPKRVLRLYLEYYDFEAGQTKCRIYKTLHAHIDEENRQEMKWIVLGLDKKVSCEEVWWNCAWLRTKAAIVELEEIRDRIYADKPLEEEQLETLNWYISHGWPHACWFTEDDRGMTYRIYVSSQHANPNQPPLDAIATSLMVQPAFAIAQLLQAKCSQPRYVKICRAPSCGKKFYTGRKNANACPSKRSDVKSPCALEWVRYKRYLQKIGKKPEKDWNRKRLKKDFISYDNS